MLLATPQLLSDAAATDRLAARLAAQAGAGDAVLLEGPLGAGKTAFARAFLRSLTGNSRLEVPSPSFTLLQSYDGPGYLAHHLDLFRLSGAADLVELGWEELRDGMVLVEWPDRLGALRPTEALTVTLAFAAQPGARWITLAGWTDRTLS